MPDGSLANAKLNGSYEQFSFLPGLPGGLPSIRFDSIDDGTGFWYDPDTKSVKLRFAGTDVYTFDDAGGLTMTVVTLQADGVVGAPSYSFSNEPTTGFYRNSAGIVSLSMLGVRTMSFNANITGFASNVQFGWYSATFASADLLLARDAAATLAQRNGTNAQTFRIYNTYTDASNYERGYIRFSSNQLQIGTEALGTGTNRSLILQYGGSDRLQVVNAGLVVPTGTLLVPDGTGPAPSYGFTNGGAGGTGMWLLGSNSLAFSANGHRLTLDGGFLSGGGIAFAIGATASNPDVKLFRDAAATFAQRDGTAAQTFRIYNTYTDASNYERLEIGANVGGVGANTFGVLANNGGTGSNRDLYIGTATSAALKFRVGGTDRFQMSGSTGHLIPTADVTYDFGGTSNFVKDVYARRRINKIATITYSASMTPDAALGEIQQITVTNATAHTINAPTNPLTGQHLRIQIRNTSGGALGVATWNAVFKMSAWTQPANANSRSIEFFYDGTNWIEHDRTTVDVPN